MQSRNGHRAQLKGQVPRPGHRRAPQTCHSRDESEDHQGLCHCLQKSPFLPKKPQDKEHMSAPESTARTQTPRCPPQWFIAQHQERPGKIPTCSVQLSSTELYQGETTGSIKISGGTEAPPEGRSTGSVLPFIKYM